MKMTRNDLLHEVTKFELKWFVDNLEDKDNFENTVRFFAKGGYVGLSDENLELFYKQNIAEEEIKNG
jgi:hypothetical protein